MKLILLIAILASLSTLSLLIVIALWRHKKAISPGIKLIGEWAQVSTTLEPEGAVLVQGELWRARSRNEDAVSVGTQVTIVAVQGHLLIVDPSE